MREIENEIEEREVEEREFEIGKRKRSLFFVECKVMVMIRGCLVILAILLYLSC